MECWMKTSGIPVKSKESHIASEDKEEQPSILDSSLTTIISFIKSLSAGNSQASTQAPLEF